MISCTPAELLMFMRVFNPLEMQWSYRARKSAVVEAEEIAVAAGGDGLRRDRGLLRTTSAQEGELARFRWYSEEQVADAVL
jgi:hypothetical protein